MGNKSRGKQWGCPESRDTQEEDTQEEDTQEEDEESQETVFVP